MMVDCSTGCGDWTSTSTGDAWLYFDVGESASWDFPSADSIKLQHKKDMLDEIAYRKRQKPPRRTVFARPRQQAVWKPQNF